MYDYNFYEIEFVLDEDGNIVLDENGNLVYNLIYIIFNVRGVVLFELVIVI